MSTLYYSSSDKTRNSRSSHFHHSAENAQAKVDEQNQRAESMGINTRYFFSEIDDKGIESKEIRE